MTEADELLKKWYGSLEYVLWINSCEEENHMQKKCWVNDESVEFSEEYTTLMKDTIKYVNNLKEKEKS